MQEILLTEAQTARLNMSLFSEEIETVLSRPVMVAARHANNRLVEALIRPLDGEPLTVAEQTAIMTVVTNHQADSQSTREQRQAQRTQQIEAALTTLANESITDLDNLLANLDVTTTRQALVVLARMVKALTRLTLDANERS